MIGNMSQVIAVSAILGFASFAAWGQAAGNVPRFEVASVKPSVPAADGRRPMSIVRDPGRIDYKNIHLLTLLYEAYGVREDQVIGPPEFNSAFYDVVATMPPGTTPGQLAVMFQTLLAERLKLKVHRETRELPVYAVAIAPNGLRMHAAQTAPDEEGPGAESKKPTSLPYQVYQGQGVTRITGKMSLSTLIGTVRGRLDRPMLDMTALKGDFDIKLEWASEGEAPARAMGGAPIGAIPLSGGDAAPVASAPGGSSREALFSAMAKQLGLKVDARKAPVEMLVIDHVERVPTEN
jgi:uncharacterized protein (TIGR03435 family)